MLLADVPMRRLFVLSLLAVAATAQADIFSAADVPGAGIHARGRVVISNDGHAITAYRFFGNIREALVSIESSRTLPVHSFGAVLFDSTAPVPRTIPSELAPMIAEASRVHGVDPRLVAAIARRESAWKGRAVSTAGACGLMQLMPATARFLGISDIFDVRQNIAGGTRYLRSLLDAFHGDLDLTLAAYNAGPGAVLKYGGVPPYRETRAYVAAVRAEYERALRN